MVLQQFAAEFHLRAIDVHQVFVLNAQQFLLEFFFLLLRQRHLNRRHRRDDSRVLGAGLVGPHVTDLPARAALQLQVRLQFHLLLQRRFLADGRVATAAARVRHSLADAQVRVVLLLSHSDLLLVPFDPSQLLLDPPSLPLHFLLLRFVHRGESFDEIFVLGAPDLLVSIDDIRPTDGLHPSVLAALGVLERSRDFEDSRRQVLLRQLRVFFLLFQLLPLLH